MVTAPPEALVVRVKVNPLPLPPLAVKVSIPRGGTTGAAGDSVTPAPTATLAVALPPRASTTWTTSVTEGVGPAV